MVEDPEKNPKINDRERSEITKGKNSSIRRIADLKIL